MQTQQAAIPTEPGTVIRTTRGRRRPQYQAGPALVTCPVCNWVDFADTIAAGKCVCCATIARNAAKSR